MTIQEIEDRFVTHNAKGTEYAINEWSLLENMPFDYLLRCLAPVPKGETFREYGNRAFYLVKDWLKGGDSIECQRFNAFVEGHFGKETVEMITGYGARKERIS